MDALITQAGQFIQTHQAWAGVIIFLMTFGESLFVIGIFLPATVLLMMSGGLVGSGILPALPIFLWGVAGAILGDALSYWLGKWFGPRVLRTKLLKTRRTMVARARLMCFRYGFLA
ncbi:MAG: DedA family protein, partial [Zwartia sp.]